MQQQQQQPMQQQAALMAAASPSTFLNPVAFATAAQMSHIGLSALAMPNALTAQAVSANTGNLDFDLVDVTIQNKTKPIAIYQQADGSIEKKSSMK